MESIEPLGRQNMFAGYLFALDIDVAGRLALFLHKGRTKIVIDQKPERSIAKDTFQKIRCPLCKWTPDKYSLWTCWDVGYPEYFYDGCGTEWNTFDTRGVCPICNHQWQWTSCLSCWGWSRHEDWYED